MKASIFINKIPILMGMIISFCILSCNKNQEENSSAFTNENSKDFPSVSGSVGGHSYVDLGLSVKWATCNIGANIPEDYGDYFAWGETSPKDYYGLENYSFYNGFKKDDYDKIGDDISMTQYDAAYVNWGNSWRMPTRSEFKELEEKCKAKYVNYKGVKGQLFTAPNGNSIFFPATGYKFEEVLIDAGKDGCYWTSEIYYWLVHNLNQYDNAYAFGIGDNNYVNSGQCERRFQGLAIRAVYGTKNGNLGGGSTSDNSMYFTNFTWTATQTSVTVKFYTNERATSATIKYGENSASSSKSATITNKEISTTITGLKKGTKYYVKCIARNSTGSVNSEEYPVITNY